MEDIVKKGTIVVRTGGGFGCGTSRFSNEGTIMEVVKDSLCGNAYYMEDASMVKQNYRLANYYEIEAFKKGITHIDNIIKKEFNIYL